jgi:restriction system protein
MLRAEILEHIRGVDYLAFERIVIRLLTAMGYENACLRGRTARSSNRDGGADLEATARTGSSVAKVLVQAKQYAAPVQAKYVDELRGVMARLGAGQGLIVSTAGFSPVAVASARACGLLPVRLIGGDALARLLIRYRVGVRPGLRVVLSLDWELLDRISKGRETKLT